MFPLKLPGISRDTFSLFSKREVRNLSVGLGKVRVLDPQVVDPASLAGISQKLDDLKRTMAQTRLSQVPINIFFYGGLLPSGNDTVAPPADDGGFSFINSITAMSNGLNTIPATTATELVRIGYGLDPAKPYATAQNSITLPSGYPTSPLTYLYPGTVVNMDFVFRSVTQFSKDVVVGAELGIDVEQTLYSAYANAKNGLVDDFDTWEHHGAHSFSSTGGPTGTGGIVKWNDFDKEYSVFSVFQQIWQRNCRCILNNFMTIDTITVVEWDVNALWQPNLRQLTQAIKFFQSYPTSIKDPGETSWA